MEGTNCDCVCVAALFSWILRLAIVQADDILEQTTICGRAAFLERRNFKLLCKSVKHYQTKLTFF